MANNQQLDLPPILDETSQEQPIWEEEAKPKKERPGMMRTLLEFLVALIIALILTWAIKTFLVEPFEVPSGSMEQTIMTNDKILADKISYNFTPIQRGDIIVFADKGLPNRTLVKRVIASGGQTVDIKNDLVYVDDVALYEPYIGSSKNAPLTQHLNNMKIEFPFEVPDGELWVMGDNRENSADSRYFGSITESSVYGKAIMVFWPMDHIGPLMQQQSSLGNA